MWPGRSIVKRAADVGAGTGILTRALRRHAGTGLAHLKVSSPARICGGRRMNQTAPDDNITYREGRRGEILPCGDASLGLITAAQAIQFFDRPVFYAECDHALTPAAASWR